MQHDVHVSQARLVILCQVTQIISKQLKRGQGLENYEHKILLNHHLF